MKYPNPLKTYSVSFPPFCAIFSNKMAEIQTRRILLATVSHNNNQGSHVTQVLYLFSELNEDEFVARPY